MVVRTKVHLPSLVQDGIGLSYHPWYVILSLFFLSLSSRSLPATSVDVERVFSEGRIILSHLRSRLSVQSTRALMCVGVWSKLGYVKDSDITKVVNQTPPLKDDEKEASLAPDWDAILI